MALGRWSSWGRCLFQGEWGLRMGNSSSLKRYLSYSSVKNSSPGVAFPVGCYGRPLASVVAVVWSGTASYLGAGVSGMEGPSRAFSFRVGMAAAWFPLPLGGMALPTSRSWV